MFGVIVQKGNLNFLNSITSSAPPALVVKATRATMDSSVCATTAKREATAVVDRVLSMQVSPPLCFESYLLPPLISTSVAASRPGHSLPRQGLY